MPGIAFNVDGNKDSYYAEGAVFQRWDSAAQTWQKQGNVIDLSGKSQNLVNIKLIPDGSGEFTRKMGMLVAKDNLGFGMRSWRYGAVIANGVVEQWFEEEGYADNADNDPYAVSSPQNILANLRLLEAA